ncbi:hypothetical protein D3OALGA1CA_2828 [Olavius algarvensis associated proteobacterium Delta 3]|nr:hypothetical protein D3OALGA1CA_2828 [Olavius algarvensis associated proteobacterium Delta 3]CAB5163649.1 hypothetical protein D3OALGB2SA_5597 [Olavius algarvensis associated proteobacterium Delta 3]
MILNDVIQENQCEKIQRRSIDIASYGCDDDHIIICGELHDRRLIPTYTIDNQPRPPATVHRMRICMKVAMNSLAIEEIEAEVPAAPHGECADIHHTVEEIKGLTLSPGFTAEVKKRIGGRKGCIHLTTLLLAMAPAALQGYWAYNDRDPNRRRLSGEHLEQYLVDTCRVWRREGPLVQKIARAANVTLAQQSDQGTVTTRKCKRCGHREIGIRDAQGKFRPLKQGDKVRLDS